MSVGLVLGLLAVGLAAIVAEMFIPAGGAIGIAGLLAIAAAIVGVYQRFGPLAGTLALAAAVVLAPVLFSTYARIFPRTFIGRLLILKKGPPDGPNPAGPARDGSGQLVGREGRSLTVLRPAGMAEIEGRRLNVVSAGEFIERDQPIRVVRVEGSRIVVRKAVRP